jgi:large subunit ribosomal protein L29
MANKTEKVREMSPDELRNREKELQEQLFRLRFQKSLGQLENALKIRETRRDIARVKTVLRQKQGQANAGSTPAIAQRSRASRNARTQSGRSER